LGAAFTVTSLAAPRARAQLKLPQASPAAKTSLDVGTASIEVVYHRPALRGRDVWKDLGASPDMVWRLGANEATTISFSEPVKVAGHDVAAGTYALFAKIAKDHWTLLLNKNPKQWGAYFHDDQLDFVRFDVTPVAIPKREWFGIALDPKDDRTATITIGWDTAQVAFDVSVDVDAIVARNVEKAIANLKKEDWETRLQIVKLWMDQLGAPAAKPTAAKPTPEQQQARTKKLRQTLALIEEAVDANANWWTYEWNARVLKELGEDEAALERLTKAIASAKASTSGMPKEYVTNLEKLLQQWQ
jgi:hypothetical protein